MLLGSSQLHSQNLIQNPSFEDFNNYTHRYFDTSQVIFPGVKSWWSPTFVRYGAVTSDSIENAFGNLNLVQPRTGQSCLVLVLGGNADPNSGPKTFAQSKLQESLEAGCYYDFK